MTQAHLVADSLVTLAAIAGLLVLIGVLRRAGPADAMSKRFLFGLVVLVVLLSGRLLWWLTDSSALLPIMHVAAGFVPLCTIVLAEGLLRRHAPSAVKYGALIGTMVFTILAFVPPALVEPTRSLALLAYQFAGFLIGGWMVLWRDREALSQRENWLADRIALSLLLILPFLATDFRFDGPQLPVRMAGIAILFICWLAVGMRRSHLDHRGTVKSFAVLAMAAIVGGIGIAVIAGLDVVGTVQVIAVVLSACLVAAIFIDSMNLDMGERHDNLLSHIAYGNEKDAATFLSGLREHLLVKGAVLLGPADLAEFDHLELEKVFAADPVRHWGETRGATRRDDGFGQLAAIFDRYEVTHVMLVSRQPLMLAAMNMPALTSTAGAETELRAVQRVARLISEKEA